MIDVSQLSRYDLVAAALQTLLIVASLATAGVYLIKHSGNRSANFFFALLLLVFSASIGTLVLEHLGIPSRMPRWRSVPLWLTWSIGPAWFYYVKFSLFPGYAFRWTDLKHFVFPVLQLLIYVISFVRGDVGFAERRILFVPYRTLEELIFLLSVGGYLFGGYRYLRYRARALAGRVLRWEYWRVKLLRRAQRVIFVLLTFNFAFVAYNFAQTQISGTGLLHVRSFYASSSLSFGLILLYLLRGVAYRQHFFPTVPAEVLDQIGSTPTERLQSLIEREESFRDPDLHRVRTARAVGVDPSRLDQLVSQLGHRSWSSYITQLRLGEISRLRKTGLSLRKAALRAGFASRQHALRAFKKRRR